jgi:4a-hydroxytetrahydrobiopterin dehydratase
MARTSSSDGTPLRYPAGPTVSRRLGDVARHRYICSMTDAISEAEFSAASGVEGWRVLHWGTKAYFRTGDFTMGARFVAEIAKHAAALQNDPLVDLRDESVAVQVVTPGVGISADDLELARRVSRSAAELGLTADAAAVQQLELAIDAADPGAIVGFWRAALGYVHVGETNLVEPNLIGPSLGIHQRQYVAPRNRIHVDVSVPHDQAQARVDAIVAAGGRLLGTVTHPRTGR